MAKYEFISEISESSLFRSREQLSKYSQNELANLLYLYVVGLIILSESGKDVSDYVLKTMSFGNYDHYRMFETDLYMLIHLQRDNRYLNIIELNGFLVAIARDRNYGAYHYLTKLERSVKVDVGIVSRTKRTVSKYKEISPKDQEKLLTTVIREIYNISPMSEVIGLLKKVSPKLTEELVSIPVADIKAAAASLGMVDHDNDLKVIAAIDDYFKTLNNGQYSPLSGEHNNASQNTVVFDIAKKHGVDPTYLMKYLSDVAVFDKFQKMANSKS